MNRYLNHMHRVLHDQAFTRIIQTFKAKNIRLKSDRERLIRTSFLDETEAKTNSMILRSLLQEASFNDAEAEVLQEVLDYYKTITPEKMKEWAYIQQSLEEDYIYSGFSVNRTHDLILNISDSPVKVLLWEAQEKDRKGHMHLLYDGDGYADLKGTGITPDHIIAATEYYLGYTPCRINEFIHMGELAPAEVSEADDSAFVVSPNETVCLVDRDNDVSLHIHVPQFPVSIRTEEQARKAIQKWRRSAADNFANAVRLEDLIAAAKTGTLSGFRFSVNEDASKLQRHYRDKLKSAETADSFDTLTQECRDDLQKKINDYFGPEDEDCLSGFHAVYLAEWMRSNMSFFKSGGSLIRALRILNVKPDDLRGAAVQNALIYFDPASAVSILDPETAGSPFLRELSLALNETITGSGFMLDALEIDGQGIIRYQGRRIFPKKKKKELRPVTGYIGQIFVPDENTGAIRTHFAVNNKYLLVPGYNAAVLPPEDLETDIGTLAARTRLTGYEQILLRTIRMQVRRDLCTRSEETGFPDSLNRIYSSLLLSRHEPDFLDNITDENDRILREVIIKTERGMVRYPNSYLENAGMIQSYLLTDTQRENHEGPTEQQLLLGMETPDRFYNLSILSNTTSGYFDLTATGSGKNQGGIRYLCEHASVDPNTKAIIPGIKDERCALLNLPWLRYLDKSPYDRQQLVFSNLRTAHHVSEPAGTAMMTFGGWNFDDGFVVSRRFAERFRVPVTERDSEGRILAKKHTQYRTLMVGDKICDFSGNKGVISLIVDPEMSDEDARNTDPSGSILQAVQWFRANPDLDVVGSPYTAPSRLNGGTAEECHEHAETLYTPDGTAYTDALGYARYIITHYTADSKTKPYNDVRPKNRPAENLPDQEETDTGLDEFDEEFNIPNSGRRVSAQLTWGLTAAGARDVMHEFYGDNETTLKKLREILIMLGLDIDEYGKLRVGYQPHKNEPKRNIFRVPAVIGGNFAPSAQEKINYLMEEISHNGGFLELPVPMDYPILQYKKHRAKLSAQLRKLGQENLLPVMSYELRKAFRNSQEQMQRNDYTLAYRRIVEELVNYGRSQDSGRLRREIQSLERTVIKDFISSKDNFFKDSVMTNRAPISATAVWSADPTLNLDEAAVSEDLMARLGLCDYRSKDAPFAQSHVLLWRDPVLRSGGIRYFKVVRGRPGLTGIAVNPVMDKSFDGDFDGDTIAVVRLMDPYCSEAESSVRNAEERLSPAAALLDLGKGKDSDGEYDLFLNHSMDFKTVEYDPAFAHLKETYAALKTCANKIYEKFAQDNDRAEFLSASREVLSELSDYTHRVFLNDYGRNIIRFGPSIEDHLKSVLEMTRSGAKGKAEDVTENYRYYLEYTASPDSLSGRREKDRATMIATAVKSIGTGLAGSYSIRGISVLRNICPREVTELTYPVTQAALQTKHNAEQAYRILGYLLHECRSIWRGYSADGNDSLPMEDWIEEFDSFYNSTRNGEPNLRVKKLGVSVSRDDIACVARALLNEDGTVQNLEKADCYLAMGSPLDILSYRVNAQSAFENTALLTLTDYAMDNADLFDGVNTSLFRPDCVCTDGKPAGFWEEDTVSAGEAN